ncbi:MAG: DUF1002 domain-containing protein [Desemzia incerta]|uniref:DUF1002 domain-containing protein n=1 Tax=Desemzia incerta TaxID=82801 RepID=UPI003315CDD1
MTHRLKKLGIKTVMVTGLVGGFIISPLTANASEDGIDTTVVNEKWGKPTFVYGGGLSDTEVEETEELIGIENPENVVSVNVTGDELVKYLGAGSGNTSSLISSVLVEKEDDGHGVVVDIKTPENITQITQEQYANAAITAGVADATIEVASIRPATGESALTGIYKAFDVNGEDLDQDRMEVAQDELETTNDIAQENADNGEFDPSKLDQAIIEIKQSLAELKEQQGELATKEDIERIINEALANNNLENVVTQEQIDRLMSLFENYQQTAAIDSEAVKEQLNNLSEVVQSKFGDFIDSAESSGLFDKIGNFFKQVWEAITGLFN